MRLSRRRSRADANAFEKAEKSVRIYPTFLFFYKIGTAKFLLSKNLLKLYSRNDYVPCYSLMGYISKRLKNSPRQTCRRANEEIIVNAITLTNQVKFRIIFDTVCIRWCTRAVQPMYVWELRFSLFTSSLKCEI